MSEHYKPMSQACRKRNCPNCAGVLWVVRTECPATVPSIRPLVIQIDVVRRHEEWLKSLPERDHHDRYFHACGAPRETPLTPIATIIAEFATIRAEMERELADLASIASAIHKTKTN